MYRELPFDLAGAVVWTKTDPACGPGAPPTYRVLPDGCLDLIWMDGTIIVAGPDTGPYLGPVQPGSTCVGVRFRPGQGPGAIGLPAAELRDRRLPIAQVWPAAAVRRLTAILDAATTDRPAAMAREVARLLRQARPVDPRTDAVAARLRAGHPVASTADAVGLGPRELHRMSLAAFGYGPKTLARILRFNRALALARTGVAFATVASTTGYADQAHLSREVRDLAGVTLRDLVG